MTTHAQDASRQEDAAAAPSKLSPELKARWIAGLRSGTRRQGKSWLYDDGRYCCLGVLHEIITGRTPPEAWGSKEPRPIETTPLKESDVIRTLANMNDEGKTFGEIANWIEANL